MDRKLIKEQAKAAIKGKWLFYFVILALVGFLSSLVAGIIAPVLAFGVYLITLDLLKGGDINANRFGETIKDINHALKLIAVAFLSALVIFLGFVLFIIPGIIFAYMFSQASFIMMDNPEIDIMEAMRRSKAMMKGYKFDLFIFQLSFIGHVLLLMLTIGIYGIYFTPLYTTAQINYYVHLKELQDLNVVDVEVIK